MSAAQVLDVKARDLRVGDDLFGAGSVEVTLHGDDGVIYVVAGDKPLQFDRDEEVTVRRV